MTTNCLLYYLNIRINMCLPTKHFLSWNCQVQNFRRVSMQPAKMWFQSQKFRLIAKHLFSHESIVLPRETLHLLAKALKYSLSSEWENNLEGSRDSKAPRNEYHLIFLNVKNQNSRVMDTKSFFLWCWNIRNFFARYLWCNQSIQAFLRLSDEKKLAKAPTCSEGCTEMLLNLIQYSYHGI